MITPADYSLFPKNEEWGTGDEAMDNRLSIALKKVQQNLSIDTITEFYFFGLSLQPRAYNPTFHSNIELVTKAFLYLLYPENMIDQEMDKIKGDYFKKVKINMTLPDLENIKVALLSEKKFRFKNQLDFYLQLRHPEERNPYVREPLKRSGKDLHAKIIMKDFKAWLQGEKDASMFSEPLFQSLRGGEKVLVIPQFAEIWFHRDTIFMISHL